MKKQTLIFMDLLDNFLDKVDKKRRSANFSPLSIDEGFFVRRPIRNEEGLPPRPRSVAFVRDCLLPPSSPTPQTRVDLERNGGWTLIVSEDEDSIIPTRPLSVFLDISDTLTFSKTTKHGIQKFRLPLPLGLHNKFSRIVLDTPKIDIEVLRPLLVEGGRVYTQLPFDGERCEDVFLTHYRTDKPATRKIGLTGKAMWVIEGKTMYDTLSFKLSERDYVKYASYRLKNDISPYSEVSDGEMTTVIRGKAPNVRIMTQHTEGDCWYDKCNCRQIRDRIYNSAEDLFQKMKKTDMSFTASSCQQFILQSTSRTFSPYQVDQLVELIMWFKQNSDVNEAKIAADLYTSALENNIAFTQQGVEDFIRTSNTNDDKVSRIALEILKLHQLTQSQAVNFYHELKRRCVKFPSRYDVSMFVQRSDTSLQISQINFIVDIILEFTVFDEMKSALGVDIESVKGCVKRYDPTLTDVRLDKIVSEVFNNLKVCNERPEVIAEELYQRMLCNHFRTFVAEEIRQFVVDSKPELANFEVDTLVALIREKYNVKVIKEISDKQNASNAQAKRSITSTLDRLTTTARIHNLAASIHNLIANVDVSKVSEIAQNEILKSGIVMTTSNIHELEDKLIVLATDDGAHPNSKKIMKAIVHATVRASTAQKSPVIPDHPVTVMTDKMKNTIHIHKLANSIFDEMIKPTSPYNIRDLIVKSGMEITSNNVFEMKRELSTIAGSKCTDSTFHRTIEAIKDASLLLMIRESEVEGTSSPVSDFIKDVKLKKSNAISTYEDPELELVEIPAQIDVSYVTYDNFSVTPKFLENFSKNLRKLYADKIIRYSAIIKQLELDLARMNAIIEKTGNKNASLHNIREMFPSYTHMSTHIHSIRSIIDTLQSRLLTPYQLERKFRKILSDNSKGIASIVGRTEIKDHICRVLYAFSKDHRSLINSFGTLSLLGNAGIGKTALMKVIGYALSRSGILVRKSFRVVSRHDLISQFLGSTAHHTRDVLMSSLEGVVGIDECHALVSDTSKDYGGESISELVRFVDEFIGLTYMVVCGYTEPMERMFFGQNEGLNRRFPIKFVLENYTSKELTHILLRHLHRFGVVLKSHSVNVMFTLISRRTFPNQAGDMLNLATRIHTLLMCHLSTDIDVEAQVLIQCLN